MHLFTVSCTAENWSNILVGLTGELFSNTSSPLRDGETKGIKTVFGGYLDEDRPRKPPESLFQYRQLGEHVGERL